MTITHLGQLKKLFLISWLAYFVSYIGRLNYAASMIQIGTSEGYGISQLGTIVTALFISYGIGQLVSGFLGDRYSPRLLVFIGLLGCGLCNFFVFLSTNYWQLLSAWFLNGFTLSLIWCPMLKLFSKHMPKDYLHKCCFNIQTAIALGTFFTYLSCSFMIAMFDWKLIFLCSAILLFAMAILWHITIKQIENFAEKYGEDTTSSTQSTSSAMTKQDYSPKALLVTSGLITILVAVLIMGFLKDGIMTWVPGYITDNFQVNAYFSIFLSAFLPLVNLSGIYIVKYINAKNGNDDLKTTILFYFVSMISLVLLVCVGKYSMYLSIFFFSIVTSCMLGINTILVSVLPTYFAKYDKISTVSGITNAITYLGSALCGYGLGILAENYGWNVTSMVLVAICILGIIACFIARPRWKRFKAS
ncbi:MAG: MFS transporter [Cellulosilyticaceae bacterium]